MKVALLVAVVLCAILCDDNKDVYTFNCYKNEELCKENDVNKGVTTTLSKKCESEASGEYGYLMCLSHDKIREYSGCNSNCNKCEAQMDISSCKEISGDGVFCKIEGCKLGYSSSTLMEVAAALLVFGCLGCICCVWICFCPMGLLFILIALCVAYC